MIWLPIVLAVVAMFIMAIYPLTDQKVDEMNQEILDNQNNK